MAFDPNRDKANDDTGSKELDEINVPIGNDNKLYQMDAPGMGDLIAWTEFFQQLNALEFVRVKFDAAFATVNSPNLQGSRASLFAEWHSWLYFKKANGVWSRPLDAAGNIRTEYNELDQGLKPLNSNPNRA